MPRLPPRTTRGRSSGVWTSSCIPRRSISAATTTCSRVPCSARAISWASIRALQATTGATVDPFAAYLLVRGLKTFALRMERQNTSAQALAEFLAAHSRVSAVHYAGLPSHPGHDIAKKQMRGFGGVVSFEVHGDLDTASRVVDACMIPYIAASLGGVESLIEQPADHELLRARRPRSASRSASRTTSFVTPLASRMRTTSWPTSRKPSTERSGTDPGDSAPNRRTRSSWIPPYRRSERGGSPAYGRGATL